MNELIELDFVDLVWALGMIAGAIAFSKWQQLGLESQLFWAAGRSILQLLVLGYAIAFVFAVDQPLVVLLALGIGLSIAAIVTRNRIGKKLPRLLPLVWGSLLISTAFNLVYVTLLIIQPDTWYEPQYLIPLAGVLLGNAMNGASLAGERLSSLIKNNYLEVEAHLCLGATAQQATKAYRQEAVRIGLIPTLNQMMVVGLVSLPGIFAGQILAGSDPLNAASYQILILLMIALTNLLATFLVTKGVYRLFFNQHDQLLLTRVS